MVSQTTQHFTQFAQDWWEWDGPFAILHKLTPLRIRWLKNQVCTRWKRDASDVKALQGLHILDAGCGGGLVTEPLCRLGAIVTGLDVVPENIAVAQSHAKTHNLDITYHALSLEKFAQESTATFDVLVAYEVLEHVVCPHAFLQAAATLLKPGGLLLVSTLNRTWSSYLFGIVMAERVLGWVPPGTHQWRLFIPPSDLRHLFERNRFQADTFQGLVFSPWTGQWSLSSHMSINYFASAVKET